VYVTMMEEHLSHSLKFERDRDDIRMLEVRKLTLIKVYIP
jgi:hypothetical protein